MGLGINYARLDDVLLQFYMDEDLIAEKASAAKAAIRQAIETQIGGNIELPVEPPRPRGLEASSLGSYANIHLLRAFAARVSGYTLDQAYQLDLPSVFVEEIPEKHDEYEGEEGSREESAEEDIRLFFGESADAILPLPDTRIDPFPYYNLVCFSDAEGIYVPVRFHQPITLDGYYYIGSLVGLTTELESLGVTLNSLRDEAKGEDSPKTRYLKAVRGLWEDLGECASTAAASDMSLVFE